MSTELLDVQPCELKFTFELKKQSSCSIQLVNKSAQYVAFKVKTTSPKNYCVRPNTGIVKPKSSCDFTVTMQAQRSAPPDLECKDKFLIQSTVVPFGTTEEDIPPGMFTKDRGKCIEETKLRVILISPPHSPVLLPSNGVLKQDPSYETPMLKDEVSSGVENLPPSQTVAKDAEAFKNGEDMEELRPVKDVEFKSAKDLEEKLELTKEYGELKSKLSAVESKLTLAETTITRLTEERNTTIEERKTLEQELAILRRNSSLRKVQVGFPLLFVFMVALISLALGYFSHP